MKITVLDSASLGHDLDFSIFGELGDLSVYENSTGSEIYERSKDSDVIILNKIKINEYTLTKNTAVKLICIAATGYDNVDLDFCKKNSIAVCNVKGYSTTSVAELTVAMATSLAYNLRCFNRFVSSGEYTASGIPNRLSPFFHNISGRTWGIVGYGNIGKKVAQIAHAMGCKVLVYKRTPEEGLDITDLDTLLSESDIISLHTPLNDSSKNMISKERIALMKKNAILINVARGAVCDEEAVAEAVLSGKIAALGCDVYTCEPFPADHPYSRIAHLDNVCLTPHMAWGSVESRKLCMEEIKKNIESFTENGTRCRIDI